MNSMKKVTLAILLTTMSLTATQAWGLGKFADRLKNLPLNNSTTESSTSDKKSTEAAALNVLVGLVKTESTEEEVAMGQDMASMILGAAKLHTNKKIQNYVNLVGRNIASQSERPDLPWTFGVLDTTSVNAFSAPGGYVLISKGLYDLLKTEDELAAVLGHEIAHVVHKHHFNVIKKQSMVALGADLANQKNDKKIAQMATSMLGNMLARGLDKSSEYEADRDGLVLAARAGYDSSAMLRVLESLELHGKRDQTALAHMFATHPAPAVREQEIVKVVNSDIEAAAVLSPAQGRIKHYR